MPVSEERKLEIRKLSNDEWVDHIDDDGLTEAEWERLDAEWEAKTLAFCRENSDPEELHVFADTFNWDAEIGPLKLILENPACEAATALLMYWKGAPEWFRQYSDRAAVEAEDLNLEGFDFLTGIETRYLAGHFPIGVLSFDPNDPNDCDGDPFVGTYDHMKDKFVRELPPEMYAPVIGSAKL